MPEMWEQGEEDMFDLSFEVVEAINSYNDGMLRVFLMEWLFT